MNVNEIPVHFDPESNVFWKTATPADHSSPVIWDNCIFLTDYEPADEKLNVLVRNKFTEKIFATPAIADNTIYLRTADHLCALGK